MSTTQNILSELFEIIQKSDSSIKTEGKGISKEPFSMFYGFCQHKILAEIGIKSLALKHPPNRDGLLDINLTPDNEDSALKTQYRHYNNLGTENVRKLFNNCQIIAFSDWANSQNASDLWDRLRFDVIRPLQRNDFEFIFYLGDPSKKWGFEVDEILDIISDFSLHGRVSLVMNENAAVQLWMLFHGPITNNPPTINEISQYLLKTVKIDRILILTVYQTIVFTKDQILEFVTRTISSKKLRKFTDNFNVGYSLGLHLKFEITHCIALGLTTLGTHIENSMSPDLQALLLYIEGWMSELKSPVDKIYCKSHGEKVS